MKKIATLIVLASAVFCFQACKQQTESTPESVATEALTALQKGDYKAYAATYDMTAEQQKQLAGLIEGKLSETNKEKGGIEGFTIDEVTYDEENPDAAKISATINYKDGSNADQSMDAVKVDGEWKLKMNK